MKECILQESIASKAARQSHSVRKPKILSSAIEDLTADDNDASAAKSATTAKEPSKDDPDVLKLRSMVERCGVLITEVNPKAFNADVVVSDVKRLLQPSIAEIPLREFTWIAFTSGPSYQVSNIV